MNFRIPARVLLTGVLLIGVAETATAQQPPRPAAAGATVRVTGVVRDEANAITLPGLPVEVVGTGPTVYTDVDGRYVLDLAPGSYQVKVTMEGYQDRILALEVPAGSRLITVDVGLTMAKFAETVVVKGDAPVDALTSSQEVQLMERKNAQVITDNLGAQEMRANGDSDAAAAMSRVTGLSVVDSQ